MTPAEIKQAENFARENLNRCRTLEARITGTREGVAKTYGGIVPGLCETILKLTAELKAKQGRAA